MEKMIQAACPKFWNKGLAAAVVVALVYSATILIFIGFQR